MQINQTFNNLPMNLPNDFFAITSYFNFFHNRERLHNFHTFRKNLTLPLIAVEWAPDGKFELNKKDAEYLIQIKEGDFMWQKECLLNIALEYLPLSCNYVSWLDCDIVFANPNWHNEARVAFKSFDFIQLFEKIKYVPKTKILVSTLSELNTVKYSLEKCSISKAIKSGENFFGNLSNTNEKFDFQPTGNPGMAFASKVSIIKKHKFYDKNIIGGGDLVLSAAIHNKIDELFMHRALSSHHKTDIKNWAAKLIHNKYKCSFLKEEIFHLWHGELEKRMYEKRYHILNNHNYNPKVHVALNSNKTWSWSSTPANLKEDIYKYMQNRESS